MANYATTTKYALRKLLGTSLVQEIDTGFASLADDVDALMVGYSSGLLSARPVSTGGSPGITGRRFRATDTGQEFIDHGTGWNEIQGAGDLKPTARSSAPDGWVLCDGAAISRSTFAALFAAIGTTYGVGDGSTTFNVPDLRGRVPVGVDGAAGRLDALDALGNAGGAQKHTLTIAELPAHTHPLRKGIKPADTVGENTFIESGGNAATTQSTGSDTPHNNMQPYQIVNWLVKT